MLSSLYRWEDRFSGKDGSAGSAAAKCRMELSRGSLSPSWTV